MRKLYLLKVILLDRLIKLKGSIINVLPQIACFKKVFNVSDMKYFMYPSMLRQFKACVRYFLSNFYYSPNDSLSKTMKNIFYFI